MSGEAAPSEVGTDRTLFRYGGYCSWVELCPHSSDVDGILVFRRVFSSMCIYCEGYAEDNEDAAEEAFEVIDDRHQSASSSSAGVFARVRSMFNGVFNRG